MSKILFICRHAEAADPAVNLPDFERNLTSSGIRQAQKTGAWLQARYQAEAIIASPSHRTRQTAQILSEMVPLDSKNIVLNDQLYNAPASKIAQVLLQLPEQLNNVIVVGHNPGISRVVEELTGNSPGFLEPANVAVVIFEAAFWSETEIVPGKLLEIFRPSKS
jgi:phosphohistidine phosphatase